MGGEEKKVQVMGGEELALRQMLGQIVGKIRALEITSVDPYGARCRSQEPTARTGRGVMGAESRP